MNDKPTNIDNMPYLPYFTHDCLVNNWPPGWLPAQTDLRAEANARHLAAQALLSRQLGTGWGAGTIHMHGTPDTSAPEWMRGSK